MIQWIQTAHQLQALLHTLDQITLSQPYIALDTEFVRTSHFYAAPGLLQIGWQTDEHLEIRLVDISVIKASKVAHFITQLYQQCQKNQRILVMHAPSEDLQLFDVFEISRAHMPQLLDTQIAACYLNLKQQIGLFDLAAVILNVPTMRSHAQSNWIQRPLTWVQMSYAANDVRLLIALAPKMVEALQKQNFYTKALEDCRALFQTEPLLQSEVPYPAQQSELAKVQPRLQARLAQLIDWRESAIRMLDIPRKWLLSNEALFHIAKLGDTDAPPKVQLLMSQFFRNEKKKQQLKLHPKSKDYFLQSLEMDELHQQFYLAWQELPPYPPELVPIRLGKQAKQPLATLETLAAEEATKRAVPHSAFIKRSWLKYLMVSHAQKKLGKHYITPPILTGWRQEFTTEVEEYLNRCWPYHI